VSQLRPGPQIEGLVLIEHLGTGGYSDVYLYERRSPRMKVAVKVLKDARLSDAELRQFAAEAETMAELADHPYIVPVFSTDLTSDGRPYLVMKYYPPPNLGMRSAQQRLPVPDVLRTGIQISSAVETAHRAGILHRDIKPANILVSQYDEPGLTDFGIAGRAADTEEADDLGVSIPWSPPEVLSGASNGSVQSDVYSLAATVWHLLVGRSPFEIAGGDNAPRALMARVLRAPLPPTGRADVPAALERLLEQVISKNPAARPRSALEFARALQVIEQEQRFARTEVVVGGANAGAASATSGGRLAPAGDQTSLRAPVRVTAQVPAVPQRLSLPPLAPPLEDPPTSVARPAVLQVEPEPQPTRPDSGARLRASMVEQTPASTVRRPTAPAEPADGASESLRRRGLKRAHVAVTAGAAVVAAVAVGVVLSSGHPKPGAGRNNQPTLHATDQTQPFGAPVSVPVVRADYDPTKHVIHFRWTAQPSEPGYTYLWSLADQAGRQTRTAATHLDVRSSKPSTTCIRVSVVSAQGGAASEPSKLTCGS
jgi:hypothetical protein